MNNDTIAAIATALSPSGIGIVRICGDEAFKVATKIFQKKTGSGTGKKINIAETPSHTVHYGYICDGDEIIDEVLILIMKAPRSYTCEDTVEIDCHGGVNVLRRVLDAALKAGARPAEPGEFTKRAFLNGRIDLSRAEAVGDLISAKNDTSAKNALSQLRGSVHKKILELREELLKNTAFIEAALDDPEHYSLDGFYDELSESVAEVLKETDDLIASFRNGSRMKNGIKTAIMGKPNAGKSSFLNLLSGHERAIVTDIAGTTRDIIEEEIDINGITLLVQDTAGIRKSDDIIETMGIERSKKALEDAELILYVADSSVPMDENDVEIMEMCKDRRALCLLNKSDLDAVIGNEDIRKHTDMPVIQISASEGSGLDEVEKTISDMFFEGRLFVDEEVILTNERQVGELRKASESLKLALQGARDSIPEDMIVIDLTDAYSSLGRIIGEETDDDIVDAVFEKFCMGK